MFKSIKSKIIISQLALFFFSMFILGSFSYSLMMRYLKNAQQERLESILSNLVGRIEGIISTKEAIMSRVLDGKEIEIYNIKYQDAALAEYLSKFKREFCTLSYINKDGFEEVKVVDGQMSYKLTDIRRTPFFRESLGKGSRLVILPVEYNPELGFPTIKLLMSKYSYFGNEFRGILSAEIPLSEISRLVETEKISHNGFASLIDKKGIILSFPRKDKILTNASNLPPLKTSFERTTIFGIDGFVTYAPVEKTGWLTIAVLPYRDFMLVINKLKNAIAVGIIIILIIGGIVSWNLANGITKPLAQLTVVTGEIARGNLSKRTGVKSTDEVGLLGRSFDKMVEDLEKTTTSIDNLNKEIARRQKTEEEKEKLQIQLLQSEKMSAIGQLAGGVAHEINNPMGVILGFAQSIAKGIKEDDPLYMPLKSIEREAIRCKKLIGDLLTFSRTGKTQAEGIDVNQTIDETLSLIDVQTKVKNIELIKEYGTNLPRITVNKNQIQQVIINLCNNAIDAMPDGGKITITTKCHPEQSEGSRDSSATPQNDKKEQGFIEIAVADTGKGMTEEIKKHIFEAFFTTKEVGKGTGLGLSLCYEIIQKHNGTIEVESEIGKGTTVTITLKVSE